MIIDTRSSISSKTDSIGDLPSILNRQNSSADIGSIAPTITERTRFNTTNFLQEDLEEESNSSKLEPAETSSHSNQLFKSNSSSVNAADSTNIINNSTAANKNKGIAGFFNPQRDNSDSNLYLTPTESYATPLENSVESIAQSFHSIENDNQNSSDVNSERDLQDQLYDENGLMVIAPVGSWECPEQFELEFDSDDDGTEDWKTAPTRAFSTIKPISVRSIRSYRPRLPSVLYTHTHTALTRAAKRIDRHMRNFLARTPPRTLIRVEKMQVLIKYFRLVNSCEYVPVSTFKGFDGWRECIVALRTTGRWDEPLTIQLPSSLNIKVYDNDPARWELGIGPKCHLESDHEITITKYVFERRGKVKIVLRGRTLETMWKWTRLLNRAIGASKHIELNVSVGPIVVDMLVPAQHVGAQTEHPKVGYDELTGFDNWSDPMRSYIFGVLKGVDQFLILCKKGKVDLAWVKNDRVEWVEQADSLYCHRPGYKLEARVRVLYHTNVKQTELGQLNITDGFQIPNDNFSHIEGYLIRLSTWKKKVKSLDRMFYKKLYFHSHDNLLFFSTVANSAPPATGSLLPTGEWETAPFTDLNWLKNSQKLGYIKERDRAACYESNRRGALVVMSDGCIDLKDVEQVRRAGRDNLRIDTENDENHYQHFISDNDNGIVTGFSELTTFELVLPDSIIRLQAQDSHACDLWISHLSRIMKHFRKRTEKPCSLTYEGPLFYKTIFHATFKPIKIVLSSSYLLILSLDNSYYSVQHRINLSSLIVYISPGPADSKPHQWFESVPRLYSDGFRSEEEPSRRCFTMTFSQPRMLLGSTITFLARSVQERDELMMAINHEMVSNGIVESTQNIVVKQ